MKLQAKFALYNAVTKVTVILVLGLIILLSIEKISSNHLDNRLKRKRLKVIENLNANEIDSLIRNQQSFTDYNILKEEFIVLTILPPEAKPDKTLKFTTETRQIEGETEIYRILNDQFVYNGTRYRLELGETMTAVDALKNTIRFYMLVVLVIALFITLITDYAFARIILKPFYKIIDQKINRVNDLMQYDYSGITTSTTDFKMLNESLDSLMKKISNLFLQEKQFIANVSHELLTPISVLSSRLENMLGSETLTHIHEQKIYASLKTLNRLKATVNSLLLISKVENEQYLKSDHIRIGEELDDVYESLEDRITGKHLTYNNLIKHDFTFTGNKTLIHILLVNIVNNAVKYNLNYGEITVKDELTPDGYILTISDKGTGMDDEILKHLFNRFSRENYDHEEGMGLGLAIVKSIAHFHHVLVNVESEKEKGTTVTLYFPSGLH